MIDLHCHILPGVDDGPEDWGTSLELMRSAAAQGVRRLVATPHRSGLPGETSRIRELVVEANERAAAVDLRLEILPGQEIVLTPGLVKELDAGEALTLGSSRTILLETSRLPDPQYLLGVLFGLQARGYRILLAHPERAGMPEGLLRELLHRGCGLQINAGSLLGDFGTRIRREAEELLRRGWATCLASDAHSPTARPHRLLEARQACDRLLGGRDGVRLTETLPALILCDERLPEPDLLLTPRPWLARLLGRR